MLTINVNHRFGKTPFLDGNFQHKRHSAASKEYAGRHHVTPSLFINSERLEYWKKFYEELDAGSAARKKNQDVVSTCELSNLVSQMMTDQHLVLDYCN